MKRLAENGARSSASSDIGAGTESSDSGAGTNFLNFGAGTQNSFTEVTPSGTGSRKGANG